MALATGGKTQRRALSAAVHTWKSQRGAVHLCSHHFSAGAWLVDRNVGRRV